MKKKFCFFILLIFVIFLLAYYYSRNAIYKIDDSTQWEYKTVFVGKFDELIYKKSSFRADMEYYPKNGFFIRYYKNDENFIPKTQILNTRGFRYPSAHDYEGKYDKLWKNITKLETYFIFDYVRLNIKYNNDNLGSRQEQIKNGCYYVLEYSFNNDVTTTIRTLNTKDISYIYQILNVIYLVHKYELLLFIVAVMLIFCAKSKKIATVGNLDKMLIIKIIQIAVLVIIFLKIYYDRYYYPSVHYNYWPPSWPEISLENVFEYFKLTILQYKIHYIIPIISILFLHNFLKAKINKVISFMVWGLTIIPFLDIIVIVIIKFKQKNNNQKFPVSKNTCNK